MTLLLKISVGLIALLATLWRSCAGTSSSLPASAYIAWVEDEANGLLVTKTIGTYTFSFQHKPSAYVVLQEEKRTNFSSESWDSLCAEVADMQYYTLRIGIEGNKDLTRFGLGNDQEYYARQEYLATLMQGDIQLIDGSDTLNCLMYHYERTYGIDPQASIVLAFDNKKSGAASRNKTLYFNDNHFGVGPVMLTISAQSLSQTPELTLN
jgi:hypothetical protein